MADSSHGLDLDDYGFEDPFQDEIEQQPKKDVKKDIIGIDDEIKVKRTRAPAVKLDEALLLSANGIPKLKSRAKKTKFRGKGHEWTDASTLLSLYRLWLDDLYPKARFVDALAMVEKAGHKTTMVKQRTQWLDEAVSKRKTSVFDSVEDNVLPLDRSKSHAVTRAPQTERGLAGTPDAGQEFTVDRTNDLYDASPRRTQPPAAPAACKTPADDDVPDFDDYLEAMMAEAEELDSHVVPASNVAAKPTTVPAENDYSLEDELMAEMLFDY